MWYQNLQKLKKVEKMDWALLKSSSCFFFCKDLQKQMQKEILSSKIQPELKADAYIWYIGLLSYKLITEHTVMYKTLQGMVNV